MRRLLLACCLLLVAAAPASASSARAGSARAVAQDGVASLTNGRITRTWRTAGDGVLTTSLRFPRREWSNRSSPGFKVALDGVPTGSLSGWALRRPAARGGPAHPAPPPRQPRGP